MRTIQADELKTMLEQHKLWRDSGGDRGADADLAGANLARADLACANLACANLACANLAGANLADADLAGANLAGANLAGANLAGANLAGAYLAGAYLAGANLAGAYLAGADLADADLADARNRPASLADHKDPETPYVRSGRATTPEARRAERLASAQRYREHHPRVPVVERLDAKILDAVSLPGNALNMSDWHTCETTHCRGGWAVHLAGEAGYALEAELGSAESAARAIYRASTGRAPHFYATNEQALEDIMRCAAEQ